MPFLMFYSNQDLENLYYRGLGHFYTIESNGRKSMELNLTPICKSCTLTRKSSSFCRRYEIIFTCRFIKWLSEVQSDVDRLTLWAPKLGLSFDIAIQISKSHREKSQWEDVTPNIPPLGHTTSRIRSTPNTRSYDHNIGFTCVAVVTATHQSFRFVFMTFWCVRPAAYRLRNNWRNAYGVSLELVGCDDCDNRGRNSSGVRPKIATEWRVSINCDVLRRIEFAHVLQISWLCTRPEIKKKVDKYVHDLHLRFSRRLQEQRLALFKQLPTRKTWKLAYLDFIKKISFNVFASLMNF